MDKPLIILPGETRPQIGEFEFIDHPKATGLTIHGKRVPAGKKVPPGAFFSAVNPPIWKPVHIDLVNFLTVQENSYYIYVEPSPNPFTPRPAIIASGSS